jgi:hypothetical protein
VVAPGRRQNRRMLRAATAVAFVVIGHCGLSTAPAESLQGPSAYCNPGCGVDIARCAPGWPRAAGGPQTRGEQGLDAGPPDRRAQARRQEGRQGRLPPRCCIE